MSKRDNSDLPLPEPPLVDGTRRYQNRGGKWGYKQSFSRLQRASLDGLEGFCLACGAEARPVEPDARKYPCEGCRAPRVYGADELIMMGLFWDDWEEKA